MDILVGTQGSCKDKLSLKTSCLFYWGARWTQVGKYGKIRECYEKSIMRLKTVQEPKEKFSGKSAVIVISCLPSLFIRWK